MENRRKLTKWLTGYMIFLSLLLTANHFIELKVDIFLFGAVSTIMYLGVYFFFTYRSTSMRIVAFFILFVLFIYAADYGLSFLYESRQQDLILQNGAQVLNQAEGRIEENKRHEVTLVHSLRDFMDYKNVIRFGDWLVNERIYDQVLYGKKIEINKRYEFYFLTLLSLIMTLILSLVLSVKWLKLLLICPILLFVWLWYQFIDLPWMVTGLYFGGIVAYFIMDHHDQLLKTHQDYDTAYYPPNKLMVTSIATGLVVIALSGAFTLIFPIKTVNRVVDIVTPNLWGARSGYSNDQLKMYSLKETPFSGTDDILGGPVGPINSEDPIFWVKFEQEIDSAVYLKTNIKDAYDGLKWSNNGTVYKNGFKYYLADPNNVELLESGAFDQVSGSIRVNRKETKTVTLFAPMGLYETSLGNKRVYVSAENEAFFKAGAFVKYLEEYDFSATQRDFYMSPDVDYLQLSNRVEQRTIDLAKTLGDLGETDFDKMAVFMQFLNQNYEYSLTPLSNRNKHDFVSEFLFETKKGYCTYFASSLAIMARINGIPARYVEGFRVDPGEVGEVNEFSKVTEKDAHAWAEVFLENYGWVIFESTPTYAEPIDFASIPTLEDIIGSEEDGVNVVGENGEVTTVEPVDINDLMAEGDGGKGDFEGNINPVNQAEKKMNVKVFIFSGIVLMALIVAFIASKLPIRYMKRRNTHAFAVRCIYFLALLSSDSNGLKVEEPEQIFRKTSYPTPDVKLWLRILYDRSEHITDEMIIKSIDALNEPIKIAKENYILRKGKWGYFKMRLFKINKLIP